jgi:hypothetical protein
MSFDGFWKQTLQSGHYKLVDQARSVRCKGRDRHLGLIFCAKILLQVAAAGRGEFVSGRLVLCEFGKCNLQTFAKSNVRGLG